MKKIELLREKAAWVRKETIKIHGIAPETRVASSLSAVEILTVLYYGGIINYDSKNLSFINRDRFIISKAHGSISFYPILSDLGFINKNELNNVCKEGAALGGIPDMLIPGYETINGSLGHGLGVACGMALALKNRNANEKIFVLLGDGELFEGSVWEAAMFAGQHKLDNLILIIDRNKACMLGYCKNIIDLDALDRKFIDFKWEASTVDGHDVEALYNLLVDLKSNNMHCPKVVIADTIKGKGIDFLENDPLSHVKTLNKKEIDSILEKL